MNIKAKTEHVKEQDKKSLWKKNSTFYPKTKTYARILERHLI